MQHTNEETRARWRFFLEHAGGIVGERARGALELARAEALLEAAIDAGAAAVQWRDDDEPYDYNPRGRGYEEADAADARRRFDSNAWTGPYGCIVWAGVELATDGLDERYRDPRSWSANASLWGIVLGPRGTVVATRERSPRDALELER